AGLRMPLASRFRGARAPPWARCPESPGRTLPRSCCGGRRQSIEEGPGPRTRSISILVASFQHRQLRFEGLYARRRDPRLEKMKLPELPQPFEMLEPGVRNALPRKVQLPELNQALEALQAGDCDLLSHQVQVLQRYEPLEVLHAGIRDAFH